MICFAHSVLDEMLGTNFISLETQGTGDNVQRSHPGFGTATEIVSTSNSCVPGSENKFFMGYILSESNPANGLSGGLQVGAAATDDTSAS
jgi:hypothetical protein